MVAGCQLLVLSDNYQPSTDNQKQNGNNNLDNKQCA
jgi:hypothetical protein